MTTAHMPAAAPTARQARQITKGFTARLLGRDERGADRKVRRNSYDVNNRRAKNSRAIGDGTKAGAMSWIDCMIRTVVEWDNMERQKNGGRPLGLYGIRVLEVILGRHGKIALDFRTGRLDPAINTIARVARVGRTTVVKALARLKAMRILDWVRRTEATDNAGQAGPQRRQVTSSYVFTPEQLPARVYRHLRNLVARAALRRAGTAPAADPVAQPQTGPADPELRAALDGLERGLSASPPSGQYPSTGVKG